MSNLLKGISQLVENEMAGYTLGTNLFHGYQPANEPMECTALIYSGIGGFEFDLPDSQQIRIQMLSRANDMPTAFEDNYTFFEQYKRRIYVDIPLIVSGTQWVIQIMEANHPPYSIGIDQRGRFEVVTNFLATIKIKE